MLTQLLVAVAHCLTLQAPVIDPKDVENAVRRGCEFLRKQADSDQFQGKLHTLLPLKLLTFRAAGIPEADPDYSNVLRRCAELPLIVNRKSESVYVVALLAMALEDADRVRFQKKIAQCAQVLVDAQCQDGSWGYEVAGDYDADLRFSELDRPIPKKKGPRPLSGDGKPLVERKVSLRKSLLGQPSGDNSNSQYAALGLRAAYDAGVVAPEEVVRLAAKCWLERQFEDPGAAADAKAGTPTGGGGTSTVVSPGRVAGWNYGRQVQKDQAPYGAMTAGGAGALVIYDYLLQRNWKSSPEVSSALRWMERHYQARFEKRPEQAFFYYLYAVERLGTLYGTDKFGSQEWYPLGASYILKSQQPDGSWVDSTTFSNRVSDTCFAILFLKRATRPLDVATPSKKNPPK